MGIKFGMNQRNNPTPANYERNAKIWIIVTGIIMAWMPTNNIVPHHIQDVITPILNLLNSIILALLPMFGIEVERKTVPVQDVTAMEPPAKPEN